MARNATMSETAKVLLVEDNPADAFMLRASLQSSRWGAVDVHQVDRVSAAVLHLRHQPADVVLLDLGLPDVRGLDAVRTALAGAPGVPLVVLTGMDDKGMAEQALKEGAQDYLVKGEANGELVMRSIRYAMLRQQMRDEADRARREQLALKDEFLSHVSHELRSPLAVVHQFVTILEDGLAGEMTPTQREYLGIARHNAQQLGSMIDDLLEITRAQVGKLTSEPRCMDIAEAIEQAVAGFQARAAEKRIALVVRTTERLPTLYADPRRVAQVLANLLDNAIKFTPEGGTISVGAAPDQQEPDQVRCRVSDSGCGMSAEETRLVFERLYQVQGASTASRKGLGLGLYISKELIHRQGGRIWAESELGKGSTFAFTLPVFALPKLILPVLAAQSKPVSALSVLRVELCGNPAAAGDGAWDDLVREAYRVVQRCVLPDLDVLLPRVGGEPRNESLFIVAVVDAPGAGVLARRVREQLAGTGMLAAGGVQQKVSVHPIPLPSWSDPGSLASSFETVVPNLEALIRASASPNGSPA
jgi:signal transduction histidine kinase